MNTPLLVTIIVIVYIVFVFVVLRFITPHLGFAREPLPPTLPQEMTDVVARLNHEAENDEDYLHRAFDYVTDKYHGSRYKTITLFWYAWRDPLTAPQGFMHCTGVNYILRTLLVKSGRFTEHDIQIKTITTNLFIHQYLKVRLGDEWIDLDPWAHFTGVPFGKKSRIIR